MQCPLALFCFLTLVMIIPTLTNYKYLNNQSFRLVCYEVQITLGARGSSALVGIMHGATRGCKAAIFTASLYNPIIPIRARKNLWHPG